MLVNFSCFTVLLFDIHVHVVSQFYSLFNYHSAYNKAVGAMVITWMLILHTLFCSLPSYVGQSQSHTALGQWPWHWADARPSVAHLSCWEAHRRSFRAAITLTLIVFNACLIKIDAWTAAFIILSPFIRFSVLDKRNQLIFTCMLIPGLLMKIIKWCY
jgi:hypothetical protein